MPDHFHLIVNPRDGNVKGFAGVLKSLSARKIIQLTGNSSFSANQARFRWLYASSVAGEFQSAAPLEPLDDLAKGELYSCQSGEGSFGVFGKGLSLVTSFRAFYSYSS